MLIITYKIGGLIRFKQSEIEEYIKNSRRETPPKINIKAKPVNDIDKIVKRAIESVNRSKHGLSKRKK